MTPEEAAGADAAARTYYAALIQPRFDHDDPAIWLASAVGPAMPTGAAAACGICRAKACNRACKQNCREKVFHVLSLD